MLNFPIELIAKIRRLRFQTRRTFHGVSRGDRRSKESGIGIEFTDFRPYHVGDDLRYVDWNLYARSGRLFLKQFQAEQNLSIFVIIDVSRSMDFGEPKKIEIAKQIAFGLSVIALSNFDYVSIFTISQKLNQIVPSVTGDRHRKRIEITLSQIQTNSITKINDRISDFASRFRKSGMVFLISDLLDENGCESGLRKLIARNFEPIVLHVLSREEIEPTISGEVELIDAETDETHNRLIDVQEIEAYQRRMRNFCGQLRNFCRQNNVHYFSITSHNDMIDLFSHKLQKMQLVSQ